MVNICMLKKGSEAAVNVNIQLWGDKQGEQTVVMATFDGRLSSSNELPQHRLENEIS